MCNLQRRALGEGWTAQGQLALVVLFLGALEGGVQACVCGTLELDWRRPILLRCRSGALLDLGFLGRGFGLSRLVMAEMSYITLYTARTRAFLCNGKSLVMEPSVPPGGCIY